MSRRSNQKTNRGGPEAGERFKNQERWHSSKSWSWREARLNVNANTLGRIQFRHNKPEDCKMERKIPQQQGGKMDDCQTRIYETQSHRNTRIAS